MYSVESILKVVIMAHSISTSSSSVSVTTSDSSRLCSFSIVQFSFQSDTITLTEYGDICKGKSIDISGKKDTIKGRFQGGLSI